MTTQSQIPGKKPRWPWAFAATIVPTVLAIPVLWLQSEKIEKLRGYNAEMFRTNQTLQSKVEKLETELSDLRKKKSEQEEQAKTEAETSQKELQRLRSELRSAQANARILVTKPLEAKVQSLGMFGPDPWKLEWSMTLQNATNEDIPIHVRMYCLAPDENALVLNEFQILEPVVIDSTKERVFSNSVKVEGQHCRGRATFMLAAFAKMPGGSQIPLDMWRYKNQ